MSLFLPELERELRAAIRARESRKTESEREHDPAPRDKAAWAWARRRPRIGTVAATACSLLALAIAGVLLIALRAHSSTARPRLGTSEQIPAPVRRLETVLAVLRRPQTAKDRSLPALIHRALRIDGRSPGTRLAALYGAIPSLERYTQTLPDGREVFLVVYRNLGGPDGAPRRPLPGIATIGLTIVQPDGKSTNDPQVTAGGGGATPGSLYFLARHGPNGCAGAALHNIVPDRVARIRWQFPRQDQYGYVYKTPLTVNVQVRQNVAIATVKGRAACDKPTVVTLYDARGQIISKIGNAADLNRITRPIQPGSPPGS